MAYIADSPTVSHVFLSPPAEIVSPKNLREGDINWELRELKELKELRELKELKELKTNDFFSENDLNTNHMGNVFNFQPQLPLL